MLDNKDFDLWADRYDKSVNISEENDEYPFAGYKKVLNFIYSQVRKKSRAHVLDIGFGTGVLTTQLYNEGCSITGIDFSQNMIDIAKQKMPDAIFIRYDFSKGVPKEIKNKKFDYIISTYAIHHLTDEQKIEFIKSIFNLLKENGQILIGDVSFENRNQLESCKEKYEQYWDEDETYFIGEEIRGAFSDEYRCEYVKISHCSGVFTIEDVRIH